ncbi:MAG: EpsI family protein [Candidatus Thiodiazotropha lotti]|nr:EpsI family protein [Candidatus Thiodiazotropha lotti]
MAEADTQSMTFKMTHITGGLFLALGIAAILLIYLPTVESFHSVWTRDTSPYAHGFLLTVISLYILAKEWWQKRGILTIRPRFTAHLLILCLSLMWLVADQVYVQVVTQIVLILLIITYIYGLFGYRNSGSLTFPVFLLLTVVPVWSVFSEPLQYPTAYLVKILLDITGYTSFIDGIDIHIPEGVFEVSSACSGLNTQIASIVLSLLFAYSLDLRIKGIVLLVILGSLLAFTSNVIRIYIIVLAGHYSDMQHSLIEDHIWLGWVIFSILFFAYIMVISRFVPASEKDATASNQNQYTEVENSNKVQGSFVVLTLILLASVGPAYSYYLNLNKDTLDHVEVIVPERVGDWDQAGVFSGNWKPVWRNADVEQTLRYDSVHNLGIDLYFAHYYYQMQGKEIISSQNLVYDKAWSALSRQPTTLKIDDNEFQLNEYILADKNGTERIVWQWYVLDGAILNNALDVKIKGLIAKMNGNNDASTYMISTSDYATQNQARSELKTFAVKLFKEYEMLR